MSAHPGSCIGQNPTCPCQDGDACHYEDTPTTKGWPVPDDQTGALRQQPEAVDQDSLSGCASALIAQALKAAGRDRYTAFHVGYLEGVIRELCPTETQHEKALRLLREARAITEGWLTHPVAADEAGGAHDAITDAIGAVEGVFFELAQEKAAEES